MSASKAIKEQGLPSLKYVAEHINKPSNLLHSWYKTNPELFWCVVYGVKYKLSEVKR